MANQFFLQIFHFYSHRHIVIKLNNSFVLSNNFLLNHVCRSKCESTDPTNPPLSKKKKCTNSLHEDIPAVTNEVQLIIWHWAKSCVDDNCCIQEGKDYTIQVSKSTINADVCNVSIMCRCNRSYEVTTKPNGKCSISNWTKQCNKRNNSKSKQNKLQNYFTESSTVHCGIHIIFTFSLQWPLHHTCLCSSDWKTTIPISSC